MEKRLENMEDFNTEAGEFAHGLRPRASGATLITLSGELGAGKTAFVKAVAKAFGISDVVNSPTFVLEKIYQLPNGSSFAKLVHIDAYRLEKGESLTTLGFDEVMKEPKHLVMLEWPERVAEVLPEIVTRISLVASDDGSRAISYA